MRQRTRIEIKRLFLITRMFTTPEGETWVYNTRDPWAWQFYLWTKRN